MGPTSFNNDQDKQAILDAIGGSLPAVDIPKKRSKKPYYIIFGAGAFLIGLFVLILIVNSTTNKIPEQAQLATVELTPENMSKGTETVQEFMRTVANSEYQIAQAVYVHPLSSLAFVGVSDQTLTNYTGEAVDWSTCQLDTQNTYETAQVEDVDGLLYDVVYIPASCKTDSGVEAVLDFDVRISADYGWHIYNIMLRTV